MFQNALTVFFQLCLATLALAAPIAGEVTATGHGDAWQYGTGGGIIGFIVLVLDIIVFIEVLQSNRPPSHKILWCLVVFLFPVIGMIVYWLFSNRQAHKAGSYEPLP
ncbi:hypothetical protein JX265_010033 [Neoarthrinium moseri]|uniref:Cardiolipin synthase N-terminal domain-containing protein n=1 Tax=Neoarthrinium moseri TaxID=1658444 RepID=A0A9P9WF49_9PEZI|nr:uncharacterized protein JN550_012061 [Neoarthrinium moseri]KAI1844472.1 hypothetical protein JX266_009359 [Neoarthrinium moseri]KAI1859543.1 hypothetical protein JN550_012061 [Neoarthrinium moseri]KAI1860109.1 hypothetical protein JX265_010033 [Neoarthrinium moseri]